MIARLTPEQRQAMQALPPGEALELLDEDSQRSYVLFDKPAYEAWVWQQVQIALDDDFDEEWEVESVRQEALDYLNRQNQEAE